MYQGVEEIPNFKTQCTGTYVTQVAVFTVAHCFFDLNGTRLRNDEMTIQWWYAGQYIQRRSEILLHHPDYKSKAESNFGIAFVDTLWFKSVSAIHYNDLAIERCNMYSYGWSEAPNSKTEVSLRSVPIIINETHCDRNSEPPTTFLCGSMLMDCGICTGDDGAVLICDGFLHGLFATQAIETTECAPAKDVPLYFSNIYSFKKYIYDKTGLELGSSFKSAEIYLILAATFYNLL